MPCLQIALVTETYPPEINGVAMSVQRFADGLRERGHTLQLVRPRQADDRGTGQDHEILTRAARIPRYPHLQMGWCSPRRLVDCWRERRPDVVHIATEGPLGFAALRAARKLGVPVSSSFHTNFHAYSMHYGIGWLQASVLRYLRHFHNRAGCTMVPTDAMQKRLAEAGFERLHTVARGVDTQLFSPARRDAALRAEWGVDEETPAVLYVGRLAGEKRTDLAIRAFKGLRAGAPRARMIWVGDGPLHSRLKAALPADVFCGIKTGAELARHYASADIFVFPSLSETWGNVVTEAMASGLAVLAFDYAAAHENIRSGENGLLVPFGDEDAFEHAAQRLVDIGYARALGARAAKAARGIDWGACVARFEQVLLNVSGAHTV